MFKRYSQYAGGTADPMIIHWPRGFRARGEVRDQYHHCTDSVPTILECCGLTMPDVVDGVRQLPLSGVSMRYSFDDADAPTAKETQYYEMLSTRGLWHNGWKLSTEHGPMIDKVEFDRDRWQLFHVDVDRAEAHDVAAKHPEKVKQLSELWLAEAETNNVLPLNDYGVTGIHSLEYKVAPPANRRYTYYPDTSEIPEASAARTLGGSFKILAEVEFTPHTEGVIVSQGSRFGGYTLFVKNDELIFVPQPGYRAGAEAELSGALLDFAKASVSEQLETLGTMTLHVDDKAVAARQFRTQSGHYALVGEGLAVGRDSADPVSAEYTSGFVFTCGRITTVTYDIGDDAYLDLERRLGRSSLATPGGRGLH
jgi:arylsulfatase